MLTYIRSAPVAASLPPVPLLMRAPRLAWGPLLVFVALLASDRTARADIVEMSDGSRLVGTIERMQDGSMALVTEFAGTIQLDVTKIVSIRTGRIVNVDLDTGDRLVGAIDYSDDVAKTIVKTAFGDIPVPVERVSAIWPEGGKSPETLALETQIEQEKAAIEAQLAKWSIEFELGVLFREGNTEKLDVHGGITGQRKSPIDLFTVFVRSDYAEQNKLRSEAEVRGGMMYEHLIFPARFRERLFAYGSLVLEYDEFENLDLRVNAAVGAGFYWLKREDHELKTRVGLGFQHESFFDGLASDEATLDLGLDYRLALTRWMEFTTMNTYTPTFDSVRDYRLVSDNGLIFPIGASEMWKFKLGALYEYDALPLEGIKRLDQTYYASVLLSIEEK